jgi:DNA-binding MarR family transcriptional regulator
MTFFTKQLFLIFFILICTMENEDNAERLIFKLIYILKRLTDKGAARHLSALVKEDFNMTFMPYFMNIGMKGISNHDLVSKIKVTKQGVSKTVKELERLGLVYTGKSETDARSIMIFLTKEGKALHEAINIMTEEMTQDYKRIVGAKKYEQMLDALQLLIAYHEKMEDQATE